MSNRNRFTLLGLALFTTAAFADPVIVGTWSMKTSLRGRAIPGRLVITADKAGQLAGEWQSMGRDQQLDNVKFVEGVLTFDRTVREGMVLTFKGSLEAGKLVGAYSGAMGELECRGSRISEADLADPEKEFEVNSMRAAPRDAFSVLDHPKMVPAEKSKLADDQPVIGIAIGGEAKAYPVRVMGSHELVNDDCGKEPVTVSW